MRILYRSLIIAHKEAHSVRTQHWRSVDPITTDAWLSVWSISRCHPRRCGVHHVIVDRGDVDHRVVVADAGFPYTSPRAEYGLFHQGSYCSDCGSFRSALPMNKVASLWPWCVCTGLLRFLPYVHSFEPSEAFRGIQTEVLVAADVDGNTVAADQRFAFRDLGGQCTPLRLTEENPNEYFKVGRRLRPYCRGSPDFHPIRGCSRSYNGQ